ncbi:SpoIIE family protein phosphatase [Streptomyces sp. NPDC002577]
MSTSTGHKGDGASPFDTPAAAVLDEQGMVLRWSRTAEELVGRTAGEVCGHPVRELLADIPGLPHAAAVGDTGIPASGRAGLRHRSGGTIDVTYRVMRLASSELLVLAIPTSCVTDREQSVAFARALFAQDVIGVGIHDTDLNIVRTNVTPEMFGGPAVPAGSRLRDVMSAEDAEAAEAALRQVLETGVPVVAREQRMRSPLVPGRQWTLSLSAFRLEDERGRPTGVAAVVVDATERERARRHLELLHEASARIGVSLDVRRTAQELADVLVPAFGDLAAVALADAVLDGDEPPKVLGGGELHQRRVAVASATGPFPAALVQPGEPVPRFPDVPALRGMQHGETVVLSIEQGIAMLGDPRLIERYAPRGAHSIAVSPLSARGLMLGGVMVWRTERPEPFDEDDANLLQEITSRAALGVDNARRYTREHRAAVALQQRLLPPALADTPAAETAGVYLPAGGGAGVGGDWFDVIPLPSLRLALVAGDVVGHGLHATATMGRLRTAVQTLADLELGPDELLAHLDDLVQRLAAETPGDHWDTVGATCLYAVYDPLTRSCTLASAGHPPPLLVLPDGTTQVIEISPGPPLGVGGMPFETTTIDLAPGSLLTLYTKGLIHRDDHDIEAGLRRLTADLLTRCRPGDALEDSGRALLADVADHPPRDDIALLLARTRAIPAENTASWEFEADPAVVADARKATARQLAAWGLEDLGFTTELVVSELVTNAVRYAGGPVGLRLIRENVMVCEVTDPSNTQPRLRRARTTDEGGRGLFLVAQLTTRWGCRYGQRGKTIWAEQPLTAAASTPVLPL